MSERKSSTIAALLEDKPKRGRPRRKVSRRNVYVALTPEQKQEVKILAKDLPDSLGRADIPDMAIDLLAARLDFLRRAVADRDREIPEGITDLDSLYLGSPTSGRTRPGSWNIESLIWSQPQPGFWIEFSATFPIF